MEFLSKLSRKMLGQKKEIVKTESPQEYDVLVENARQELQTAQSLFNHVSEKDLIDYAIFKMNAAERHYMFLLKEARRLRSNVPEEGGTPDWGK